MQTLLRTGTYSAFMANPLACLHAEANRGAGENDDVTATSDNAGPSGLGDDPVSRVDFGDKGKGPATPRPVTLANLHKSESCGSKVLSSEREGRLAPPTRQRSFSTSGKPELQKYKLFHNAHWVHNRIIKRIKKPLDIHKGDGKGGDCYIFKQIPQGREGQQHAASKLLKIGIATSIQDRMEEIEKDYGVSLVDAEALVRRGEKTPNFRRVEQLVQDELWNFRYNHPCNKDGRTEWFLVPTEQATRCVQRWRRFMEHNPYTKSGKLKAFWIKRLGAVKYPAGEELDNHDKRNERWDWFVDKIDEKVPHTDSVKSNSQNTIPASPRTSLGLRLWRMLVDVIQDQRLNCCMQSVLWLLTVIQFSPWLSPLVTCFWMLRAISAFGGFDPLVRELLRLCHLFLRKTP